MTAGFGVRDEGFVRKGFDTILTESLERARAVFGPDVDLRSTSALRMILQVAAAEDAELWGLLERSYYAGYVSTAPADALELLGDDLGLPRRESTLTGEVQLTLTGGVPGRSYVVPTGTVVVTASPVLALALDDEVELTAARDKAVVAVRSLERGLADLPPAAVVAVDPAYAAVYFADFGAATVELTNPEALTGGRVPEDAEAYRTRLLDVPRALWTPDAARQAALGVDGVLDVLLSDALGGVDVQQSLFDTFTFGQRQFSAERRVGEPYLFDVVVAHEFRWPWRTTGTVPGVYERVSAAIDQVRPPGVHPNVVEADHIDVGVRATAVVEPGYDGPGLLASIRARLVRDLGGPRLGSDVSYARVLGAFVAEPAVLDVRRLHLRRYPATFGRISFGEVFHQSELVEAGVGANLLMGPTELAIFAPDSPLNDVQLVTP